MRYLLRIHLTIGHLYDRKCLFVIVSQQKCNVHVKSYIVPQQKARCIRLLQRLFQVRRVQRVAFAEAAREC